MKQHLSFSPLVNSTSIVVISFLLLFLEMILIRWVGSEIRIFAYLGNMVLIACFLGIGLGCMRSHEPNQPLHSLYFLFILIAAVNFPGLGDANPLKKITLMVSLLDDVLIWEKGLLASNQIFVRFGIFALGIAMILMIFTLIAAIFVPMGRMLGSLMQNHSNPIKAYSLNLIGSLLGTWAFALLSFFNTSPPLWFGCFLVLMIFFIPSGGKKKLVGIGLSLAMMIFLSIPQSQNEKEFWSPYQKLNLKKLKDENPKINRGFLLLVNNAQYQLILNLSKKFISQHLDYFKPEEAELGPYDLPYQFAESKKNMLVVGAGTGNDCASALRNGVESVDCVEIDPLIIKLGRELHPESPYADPRAHVVIDDARSFFEKTQKKYDIIRFGLLDSHTLTSSYHNIRLDHFVYTLESFKRAKALLSDHGVLILVFAAEEKWLAERLYGLLTEVFKREPLAFKVASPYGKYGWGGSCFITGNIDAVKQFEKIEPYKRNYLLKNQLFYKPGYQPLTTDNWPYLYLKNARIPSLHLWVSVVLVLSLFWLKKKVSGSSARLDKKFFFLGSGFLLLEVQTITKAGLLWGSTWIVTAAVVTQILVWAILSNLYFEKFRVHRLNLVFVLLVLSLAAVMLTPLQVFLGLPFSLRLLATSLFLTVPVFFAGLIFIHFFDETEDRGNALGSNLLGALVGGISENLAFLFGFKFLLIPTLLFYFFAYYFRESTQISNQS